MNLSFRHYYWRWLKNQTYLFLIFAVLMTLARIMFALYFGDTTLFTVYTEEIKKALFLGLRFDLMPLAYINVLPFILLHLGYFLPGKFSIRALRFLIISILTFGYILILWLYIFDYGFYSYFQEHLNVLVFGFFEDDTKALIITLYKNYNLPLWLLLVFALKYGIYRFIRFLFSPYEFDLKPGKLTYKFPIVFLGGLTLIAFMARGNFSRLPLSVEDAFISNNEFINEVALNGALSMNRAVKIRKTFGKGEYNYLKNNGFTDWQEAFRAVTGFSPAQTSIEKSLTVKSPLNLVAKKNPPHVVLVVMESFGTYWDSKDSENFQLLGELKQHFEKGILFENFLSSENGTIGSIVSVASSQVLRPGARFLSESEFMNTKLSSSGHLPYKNSGYDTHFVYGGKLGWRNLGKYLAVQHYDQLWGADEIKEAMPELNHFSPKDLGNEWGIYDEYLYSFIDEQLRTATKPQFFLVLTTSNHPPFEFPSSYQPLKIEFTPEILSQLTIEEGFARKRFESFQYANQKAGEFLTKIKQSKLSDNTIVALTGDHSYWIAKNVGQEQEFKRYAVPFFISAPEKYLPDSIDEKKFGSHEDIFPSLYRLSLSEASYVKLGEDLFSEKSDSINGSGIVANESGAYHHGKFWRWLNVDEQLLQETEPTPELQALQRKAAGLIGLTDAYLKEQKTKK